MQPELFGPAAHDGSGATEPDHVPIIERLGNEIAAQKKLIADLLRNVGDPGICKGCKAEMFWVEHRNGKRAPYNSDGTNHFITCPDSELFKRRKSYAADGRRDRSAGQ